MAVAVTVNVYLQVSPLEPKEAQQLLIYQVYYMLQLRIYMYVRVYI